MKKRKLLFLFIWIAAVLIFYLTAYLIVRTNGRHTTLELHLAEEFTAEELDIRLTDPIVEIVRTETDHRTLRLELRSVRPGTAFIEAESPTGDIALDKVYVSKDGIITINQYLGKCNCDGAFLYAGAASFLLAVIFLIRYYRICKRECLYQYRNAALLGLILFLSFTLLNHFKHIILHSNISEYLHSLIAMGESFSWLMLPVAFIMSVLITVSNLVLMKHEGITWRNMLGALLGLTVCFSSFIPDIIEYILDQNNFTEQYRETGKLRYEMIFVKDSILACIAYLECILIGMIVLGIKSARHIPAFDKDYILILGCQVGHDGKPTKLLQNRIDRAVEFSEMQKKETGKELIFVPSGGKGSDEVVSEAECMKNYLCETGIPESRILMEDKSASTAQNIRFSYALTEQQNPDAKIAFSTTNYHVFRAGALGFAQGHIMEGIGAKTKSYFWLNAFVREFIAVLYERKRQHFTLLAYIITGIAFAVLIIYHAAQY